MQNQGYVFPTFFPPLKGVLRNEPLELLSCGCHCFSTDPHSSSFPLLFPNSQPKFKLVFTTHKHKFFFTGLPPSTSPLLPLSRPWSLPFCTPPPPIPTLRKFSFPPVCSLTFFLTQPLITSFIYSLFVCPLRCRFVPCTQLAFSFPFTRSPGISKLSQ